MTIPLDAIDPDAAARHWRREFEWHLDQIPPLMETIGVLALPIISVSRGGSRFDRPQVTGGGYVDNVPISDTGRISADAAAIWSMLVEYTRAAADWLAVPAGDLPSIANDERTWSSTSPTPNPDPLSARSVALVTIAWLIDRADAIAQLTQLEEFREQLFDEIRRARGRYRNAGTTRRARPRVCGICGECAVLVDWVDGPNGSPKPVRVGLCKVCGQVYTEGEAA